MSWLELAAMLHVLEGACGVLLLVGMLVFVAWNRRGDIKKGNPL